MRQGRKTGASSELHTYIHTHTAFSMFLQYVQVLVHNYMNIQTRFQICENINIHVLSRAFVLLSVGGKRAIASNRVNSSYHAKIDERFKSAYERSSSLATATVKDPCTLYRYHTHKA